MPRPQPGGRDKPTAVALLVGVVLVLLPLVATLEQPRFVGAAAAAPVAGDAFFFCAGQPVSAHWNDVASGKLLSQLDTPLSTFVNNPAAVVDTGAKLYRFFHQHEYPNQADYTVFSYSFASPPLHLVGTCGFSLPSSASQLGCASVDPASGQIFFTTIGIADGGLSRVALWRFDAAKCSVQPLSSVDALINFGSSALAQCVYVPSSGSSSSGVVAFYNMERLRNDDRPSIIFLDTDTSGAKTRKIYIYPRLSVFSEAPYTINLATDGKDLLWMGQVGRNYSAAVSITTLDGAATQLFAIPQVEVGLKTVAYAQGGNLLVLNVWQPSVLLDRRGNVLWRSSAPLEGSSKCPMIAGLAFH